MKLEVCFRDEKNKMLQSMIAFCGDCTEAEDAVQQAFLKGIQNKVLLEQMPEAAMKAWLYAAARNSVVDVKRRQGRLLYYVDETIAVNASDQENVILVRQLMGCLTEEQQELIKQRYYLGFNATEIGRRLGIPPQTVRTRLRKAIADMRKHL